VNILTIIPARGGSKGIPGKNIRNLGGKPLIVWTIEAAKVAVTTGDIYVNTDSEEIAHVAASAGCGVYMRPAQLGTDNAKSVDVVVEMLNTFERKGQHYDAVCLLQAVNMFIKTEADSLISVLHVPHHFNPHWVFESKGDFLHIATGESEIIPRRQELPTAYHRDGAIYITKSEVLKNNNSFFGAKIAYIESDPARYVNIDLPADWEAAELICKTFLN